MSTNQKPSTELIGYDPMDYKILGKIIITKPQGTSMLTSKM